MYVPTWTARFPETAESTSTRERGEDYRRVIYNRGSVGDYREPIAQT